jgi:ferrous iron transport protein A
MAKDAAFMTIPMSNLPKGTHGRVRQVNTLGGMRQRLMDLGLVPGTDIQHVMNSPAGDPICFRVRGAMIALRRNDASHVQVDIDD